MRREWMHLSLNLLKPSLTSTCFSKTVKGGKVMKFSITVVGGAGHVGIGLGALYIP